jgi:hypothetical protein
MADSVRVAPTPKDSGVGTFAICLRRYLCARLLSVLVAQPSSHKSHHSFRWGKSKQPAIAL